MGAKIAQAHGDDFGKPPLPFVPDAATATAPGPSRSQRAPVKPAGAEQRYR
jgi:hypothetical protein